MKKQRLKINWSDIKVGSQQNLMAQRLPSRKFVDKKKSAKKNACRNSSKYFFQFSTGLRPVIERSAFSKYLVTKINQSRKKRPKSLEEKINMLTNEFRTTGRVVRNAEVKETSAGVKFVNFTVAVNNGKDKQPDYLDLVAWRKTAELIGKYAQKGNLMSVSGEIKPRTYQDDAGKNHKVYDLVVREFEVLSFAKKGNTEEATSEPEVTIDSDEVTW